MQTLIKILTEGQIRDINSTGRICFTEAPLTSMGKLFDIFGKYKNPMYAPYGIAIKRDRLFDLGARPVIYGKEGEQALLDESIRWRFEPFNPISNDFTWLREWRITKDVDLDPEEIFIITPQDGELQEHFGEIEVVIDGDWSDGQWWDQSYAYSTRTWKGISLFALKQLELMSDQQVREIIDKQNLDDRLSV